MNQKIKRIALIVVLTNLIACQQTPQTKKPPIVINEVVPAQKNNEDIAVEMQPKLIEAEILPHQHDDLWQRIRSQLSLEVPNNKEVEKWRRYYLSHPNFMVTIAKRAKPFLYYIVEEIERRNMPIELALLPIVESSYLPGGISDKSAVGLWQFMSVSAQRFNIEQNWWYDGRRDVIESTRGALDYFQFFYQTLGQDWLNAIAAFNSGEGRVGRAIKRNKKANLSTDFWSLNLPRETTNFVPKLLAIADILLRAEELNYTFTPIENSPVIAVVEVQQQLDLSIAAQWADVDIETIFQLNPGLNRWATAPDNNYGLMLPLSSVDSFKEKMASSPQKSWLKWLQYKVKSGDSLSKVSHQYGIDVASIKQYNKLSSDVIKIGQTLIVPFSHSDVDPLRLAKFSRTKVIHTVKNGDNLWDISRKYKVKVQEIIKWNKLTNGSFLKLNQQLAILR